MYHYELLLEHAQRVKIMIWPFDGFHVDCVFEVLDVFSKLLKILKNLFY